MRSIEETAKVIVRGVIGNAERATPIADRFTTDHICWLITDLSKLVENIKETSTNAEDRAHRLTSLSNTSGLPITTLQRFL